MNVPHPFPAAETSAAAASEFILDILREAVQSRGSASLAVSGGKTPGLLFDQMSGAAFPWERLQFYFVDERAVPPDDAGSNYRLAQERFLLPARFPRENVHRIAGEIGAQQAAADYSRLITNVFGLMPGQMPVFDVIQHGMGPDGHTASLFPGEPLLDDRIGIAAATHAPVQPAERITLLPGVLLAARNTVFLVDGADKHSVLQKVLSGAYTPSELPSQLICRSGKRVDWFISGMDELRWPAAQA